MVETGMGHRCASQPRSDAISKVIRKTFQVDSAQEYPHELRGIHSCFVLCPTASASGKALLNGHLAEPVHLHSPQLWLLVDPDRDVMLAWPCLPLPSAISICRVKLVHLEWCLVL